MNWIERLISLRYGISSSTVLNAEPGAASHAQPPDPDRLGHILLGLRARVAPTEGLDYGAVAKSEAYLAYPGYVAELRSFDPKSVGSRERQLAFWINLYNGLVVDAVVQCKIQRSVREVPGFFWWAAYNIGGLRYSATDIENGILRGNAPHPAVPGAPFGPSDPRRDFSIRPIDPRVHFALVCASRSCPPVAVYDAGQIDRQLDLAARAFVRGGGAEFDPVQGRACLSRIFQWYAVDFGANRLAMGDKRPLLRFIAAYLPPAEAKLVLARRQWAVVFQRYDWSLNGPWTGKDNQPVGDDIRVHAELAAAAGRGSRISPNVLAFPADPKRWFLFTTLVVVAGIAWTLQSAVPLGATTQGRTPSPRVGFAAPDFSLDLLGGGQVTLSELRGKVVILNLWASWCPPCRAEMPALQRIYESNRARGLEVLAVNTTFQDSEASAAEFVREFGLSFPVLLDRSGQVSRSYLLRALPTTFFIDRGGVIREVVLGGPMSETKIRTAIEELLEEE